MNFRKTFGPPAEEKSSGARSLGEMRPLHPFLRAVALVLVIALTLTGPIPQVALAATVYSLVDAGVTSTGTFNDGDALVVTPSSLTPTNADGAFTLQPLSLGGILYVQSLFFDGVLRVNIPVTTPNQFGDTAITTTFIPVGSASIADAAKVSVGGGVSLASIVEPGMFISFGPLSLTVGGDPLDNGPLDPSPIGYVKSFDPSTLSVVDSGGRYFAPASEFGASATAFATKSGLFDGMSASVSGISSVKLADGGTLDLGGGLNLTTVADNGLLLAGSSASIFVSGGTTGAGTLGSALQAVRVDSSFTGRTLLNVSTGSGLLPGLDESNNPISVSTGSEVFLDVGQNIDVIKTGVGILRLGTLGGADGLVAQGAGVLSAFSGVITVNGGTLQIGDNFLGVSAGGTVTNGIRIVTVNSVNGLKEGMAVTGSGIALDAKIIGITPDDSYVTGGPGQILLDKENNGSGSSIIAGPLSSLIMGPTTTVALTAPTTFSSLNSGSIAGAAHYLGVAATAGGAYELSYVPSVYTGSPAVSLTIDGAAASDFSGVIVDELPSAAPYGRTLSLVKRGSGSLTLRSDQSTFTGALSSGFLSLYGGVSLYEGSLIVSKSSSFYEDSQGSPALKGPLGGGVLNLLGGTLFIDSGISTTLHNSVYLSPSADTGTFTRTVTFAGSAGSKLVLGTLGGVLGEVLSFGASSIYTDSLAGGTVEAGASYASSLNLNVKIPVIFEGKLSGGPNFPDPGTQVLVVKTGNETLTLAAENEFLGDFRIDAGTVRLGNDLALGGNQRPMYSVTVKTGGVLDLNGTNLVFDKNSDATPEIPDLIATVLSLGGGTLTNSAYLTAGTSAFFNGDVLLTADSVIGGTGQITLGGSLASEGQGQFTLTKNGKGRLLLAGNGTMFAGTINVQQGNLQIGDGTSGSIGSGSIKLGASTSLYLYTSPSTSSVFSNPISGLGGVIIGNSGTYTLAGLTALSGANSYTGSTKVNKDSKLILASAAALGLTSAVNIDSGGVLDLNGNATVAKIYASGSGQSEAGALVNSNTLVSGVLSGALFLSGSVSIGGAGVLSLAGTVTGSSTGGSGAGILTITGPGSVVLTGTNTQVAGFQISAGTLQVGTGGSSGNLAGGTVAVGISGPGTLLVNRTGVLTLSNVLSGAGALKLQTGSLVLAGTSSAFTGVITALGGTLSAASGKLSAVGALNASAGLLSIVDYNAAAPLSLSGAGRATVSGTDLLLVGAISNTNAEADSLLFSATSGTITLASLSATGSTGFNSNAILSNGLSAGTVRVSGLLTANISGGSVTTGSLVSTTITGGTVRSLGAASVDTIAGSSTSFTAGGVATLQTVNGGNLFFNGATATIGTLNGGALTIGGGTVLTVSEGSSAGVISGNGALTKSGAAALTLSGVNTYSGSTNVTGGTLFAGTGALSGSGTLVVSSGSLAGVDFKSGSNLTLSTSSATASFSGNGGTLGTVSNANTAANSLLFSGTTGTITLSSLNGAGSSSFANNATITGSSLSSGTVSVGGLLTASVNGGFITAGSLSAGTLSGGIINVTGAGTAATVSGGSLTVGGSAILTSVSGGTLTLNGASTLTTVSGGNLTVGGAATLTSVSGGTLTLNGASTLTTVSGGLLNLNGTTASIGTFNAGSLVLGSSDVLSISSGAGAGVISGSGALTKSGSGLLTLSAANTFTGATTVNAGTLTAVAGALGSTTSLAVNGGSLSAVDYNQNATLTLGAAGSATISGTGLNLSGSVVTNANTAGSSLLFSGISGTITLGTLAGAGSTRFASDLSLGGSVSAGSVTVAGIATTSGLSGGSLTVGGSASIGSVSGGILTVAGSANLTTVSGGVLNLNGSVTTLGTLNGGALNLGALQTVFVSTGASSGLISGLGGLTKTGSGTLTLSAANTYSGTTTVNSGGTLAFVGSGSLGGAIVNNGLISLDSITDRVFAGALTGGGTLQKSGINTVTFNTASAFGGNVFISSGTLAVQGLLGGSGATIVNDATLSLFAATSAITGTIAATMTGNGTTLLSGTAGNLLNLTLGVGEKLTGTVKIGQYASLTLSTGSIFNGTFEVNTGGTLNLSAGFTSSTAKLTINTGGLVTLIGGTYAQVSVVNLNGGNLSSSGTATLYADTINGGSTTLTNTTVATNTQLESVSGTLRLTAGRLFNYASGTLSAGGTVAGGTSVSATPYDIVEARASRAGVLQFDGPVKATTAVLATVSGGTAYSLSIGSAVAAPLMDIQSGVTATLLAGGTFSAGTLQIEGTFNLADSPKSFETISLQGGTFGSDTSNNAIRATFGTLTAGSGMLSAALGGAGTITKTGFGQLTISGANTDYSGTLFISSGTVTLGDNSALGNNTVSNPTRGSVDLAASSLLQLNGKTITLARLVGSGTVENGTTTAPASLTLNPQSNQSLDARLQDGGSGSLPLAFVKSGTSALTVIANQFYTGDTTVSGGGALILASGTSLATTKVTLSGSILDLGGNNQTLTNFELNGAGSTVQNGTLNLSGIYTLNAGTVNATLAGDGAALLMNSAGGLVTINLASTYTGSTTITNGTLALGINGTLGSAGSVTVSGGSLSLGSSSQTLSNVVLTGGVISGGTITSANLFSFQNGTAGSVLSGAAKLAKSGTGSVTLSAVNLYTGGTDVSGGLLRATIDNALPSGGSLSLSAGTLDLGTTTQTAGAVVLTGGLLSGGTLNATGYSLTGGTITTVLGGGAALLTVNGSGTVNLNTPATYGGGTTVNSGTLVLGVTNTLLNTGTVSLTGGELSLGGTLQTVGILNLDGGLLRSGTLVGSDYLLNSGSVSAILSGAAALTKSGSGNVTLSGVNTYSGATQINAGTLTAGTGALANSATLSVSGGSLAAVDFKTGASLTLSTGSATASFTGAGGTLGAVSNANTAASSLLFSATSGTITVGSLSGEGNTRFASNAEITSGGVSAGVVTVGGSLRASTVSGGITTVGGVATLGTVTDGTLNLNGLTASIGTLDGASASRVTLGNAAVLTVSVGNMQGVIAGTGALVKSGSGNLTLAGANTYNGATTLKAGSLFVTGALGAGALAVGDASTLAADAPTALFGANTTNAITIGGGGGAYQATLGGSNTSGTLTFSGGVTLASAGNYAVLLQAATGGTIDFQGAWTTNNKSVTVGSAGNTGTVKLSSTLATTGSLFVTNGSTVLAGTAGVFGATTPLNVTGSTMDLGTFSTSSGKLTLANASLLGTGTLSATSFEAKGDSTIAALLGGSGALTKNDAGILTITGASTGYTGTLTLGSAGTVAFTGAGTVGGTIANSGLLTFNNSADTTLGGLISGTGALTKAGNYTLTLAQTPSYTGTTTISGGSLIVAGTLASSSIINNGTLRFNLNAGTTNFGSTLTGGGNTYLSGASANLVSSASLSFGSLYLINDVTLTLLASTPLASGTIVLDGGTLDAFGSAIDPSQVSIRLGKVRLRIDTELNPPSGLYDVGNNYTAIFMAGGSLASGTLQVEGAVDLGASAKTFGAISLFGGNIANGTLSGGSLSATGGEVSAAFGSGFGAITKSGTGTLTLSGNSPSAYAGSLYLTGGTAVLGSATALGTGNASVAFTGGTLAVLQLRGNDLALASLTSVGDAIVENGVSTGATLTLKPTGDLSFAGTLRNGGAGALSFVQNGAGSTTLSGLLSYTGSTTVSAGSLVLQSLLTGAGNVTVADGTLDLGGQDQNVGAVRVASGALQNGSLTGTSFAVESGQVSAILAGSGNFTKTTSGAAVLSGLNTLTGTMSLSAGSLSLAGVGRLSSGSLLLSGASTVLDLGSSTQTVGVVQMTNGTILNGALIGTSYALDAGSVSAVLNGTDSVTLVKTGTGTLNLSGANVLAGTVDVRGGTLILSGAGALSSGTLLVSGGATVNLGNVQAVGAVTLTDGRFTGGSLTSTGGYAVVSGSVDVALNGAVGLVKTGAASTVFLNAGNYYTGDTTLTDGTLKLAAVNALGTGALTVDAGVLALGAWNQTVGAFNLNGGSIQGTGSLTATAFNLAAGTVAAVLNGSSTVTKSGPGTVLLSAANTLSGLIDVQGGSLKIAGAGLLSTGSLSLSNGSVVDLGGTTQTAGTVTLASGTLQNGTLAGALYDLRKGSVSAVLSGAADVTKSTGDLVALTAANLLTGTVTISGGTLELGNGLALATAAVVINGGSLVFTGTTSATLRTLNGDLVLANTAAPTGPFNLTLNSSVDGVVGGVLSGSGSLTKAGSGQLTLSGANTYSGSTTVAAGILSTSISGALGFTSGITVNGGSLNAVDYNPAASLNIASGATANITGSGLTFGGSLTNANATPNSVLFSNTTGTITLGSLYGAGATRFASNATILAGSISAGAVTVDGTLNASVSGGIVTAGSLTATLVSGGSVTVANVATVATVSGGTLNLNGTTSAITTLNGGSLVLGAANVLTVHSGSSAGIISGAGALVKDGADQQLSLTGANLYAGSTTVNAGTLFTGTGALGQTADIFVNGGFLNAFDYKTTASLNVAGLATATIRGAGLTFAGSLTNANSVSFTANSGTITLGSLYGVGNTAFGSSATITAQSISAGTVSVQGVLNAAISGGSVRAASLSSQSVSGGFVDVSGNASVVALSGGTLTVGQTATLGAVSNDSVVLTLNGATSSIGTLTGGAITLGGSSASSNILRVSSGNSAGLIAGTGTFVKSGSEELLLSTPLGSGLALTVEGGTLSSVNLLTNTRSVTVGAGGTLKLTLDAGTTAYSGIIQPSLGSIFLTATGAGSTLQVGTAAALDGKFTLGEKVTLDLSRPTDNIFGDNATVALSGGATLAVGGAQQEMWIQEISTLGTGTFTFSGTGKILFDTRPDFLDEGNNLRLDLPAGVTIQLGSVTFDYLTKGGPVEGLPGTYEFTAGTVRDTGTGSSNLVNGIFTGTVLRLAPEFAKTTIYIKKQAVSFSQEIVAGGSQGTISIGTYAFTPLLTIKSGVTVILDTPGHLQAGTAAGSGASRIVDSGTLVIVGASGTKEVANAISGGGVLTKTGVGTVSFSGDNSQFNGTTNFNGGVFLAASATALGSSSLNFSGGSLQFGSSLGNLLLPGGVAVQAAAGVPVNTADNTVTFGGDLSGADALYKNGTGTLVLAGGNTAFTGSINVGEGTVQVGDYAQGGALSGSSRIVVNRNAIMRLARSANTTLTQTVSGEGTLEQAGSGTTVVSSNNAAFTGNVILKAGVLNLGDGTALGGTSSVGTISFSGGVLQYGDGITTDYSQRFSTANGQQFKVDTNGNAVTFESTLTGTNTSLWKGGAGELVLSGANNSYGGATTVAAGTLRLVGEQSGHSAIAVDGGRLVYQISSGTASGNVVMAANTSTVFEVASGAALFTGGLSGAGRVFKEGAGLLNVTQKLAQTGGFTLNGGTFQLSTPNGAASKISMGGALVLNAGVLDISGGLLTLGSTISGGSLSTLRLGESTVFVGSVSLDGLNIQIPDGISSVTVFTNVDPALTSSHRMVGAGTVQFKRFDAATLQASDLNGEVENPGTLATLDFGATSNVVFRNSLSMTGDLKTVSGTKLAFNNNLTIAGGMQLSGGTVAFLKDITVGGAVQLSGVNVAVTGGVFRATNAPVEIGKGGSPATLTLSGAKTAVVASAVQLSAGSITVSNEATQTALQGVTTLEVGTSNGSSSAAQLVLGGGTGSMTLGAAQTLKGSGTIRGNISLGDASTTLSPGNSPGKLTIVGSVNLQNGTLQIEVGKTQQDQILAGGQTLTIGSLATLLIVDYENGALSAGSKLAPIFLGGTVNGSFAEDRIVFMRNVGTTSVYSAMYTAIGNVNALEIKRRLFAATPGLSSNARGFATALDTRIITKGASDERLLELGTGSSIAEARARVSLQLAGGNPAAYAEIAGLSKQRTLTLNQGLANHFGSLRAGLIEAAEGEYNLWTTGYGTWHKQNAEATVGSAGFSGNTWGDLFGVEKRLGNLVVGVLGAAGSTSANFSALAGRVTTDTWHGGAYATAALGTYTIESGLLFGSTDSSARRTISAPGMATQEGKIKMGGSEWLLHVGLARPVISTGSFTVTPSVRLIAQGNTQESASENNMGGLEVTTQTQRTYSVLHEVGLEARQSFKLASKPASASLQMDWIHDYRSKGRALDMDLAGDSASRFGYTGSASGAEALRVGAAFEAGLTRRTTLRLAVDYQAQSKAAMTHGSVSLGYTF